MYKKLTLFWVKHHKELTLWLVLAVIELVHLIFLYGGSPILAGGDSYTYLQLGRMKLYPYSWDIYVPFGSPAFITPNLLGFQLYSHFFGFLGTARLQRILLYSLFFLKFVAFTKLARLFYKKFSWFALLPSILLVSYSAFSSLNPIGFYVLMYNVYLPFSLYYFIKIFDSKAINLADIAKLILLSVIFSPINANTALSITILIPQAVYFFTNIHRLKKNTMINLFSYAVLFFLVNLWWAIPLLRYFRTISSTVFVSGSWFDATSGGRLAENLRFIGQWGWYGGHFLHLYYPFSVYYNHPHIVLMCFAVIIAAFSEAIGYWKPLIKKRYRVYLFSLLIVSLFLISGGRPPFGEVYQFLFHHLPLFKIFREPFTKFSELYVLVISIFFYMSLIRIEKLLTGIKKLLVFFTIMVGIFLITKPTMMGEHVPSFWNGSSRTIRVDIPDYWLELEDYGNNNLSDQRILATPNAAYGGGWNWPNGFSSADDLAINFLYNNNNIIRYPLPSGAYSDQIIKDFYRKFGNDQSLDKYFGLMSIDYVLQENDSDWRYTQAKITPSAANKTLSNILIKEKEFGTFSPDYLQTIPNEDSDSAVKDSLYSELIDQPALILYRVPDHLKTPKIYSPNIVHRANITRKITYDDVLASPNFKIGDIFVSEEETLPNLNPPEEVTFTKINPTIYKVNIKNPNGPFLLQFTEQYNPGWELYSNTHQKLTNPKHLITNGFSNGWLLDSSSDLELTIEYTPQKNFDTALIILSVTTSFCLLILLVSTLKKTHKKI